MARWFRRALPRARSLTAINGPNPNNRSIVPTWAANKIHDPTTALDVRIAVAAVFALLVGCITAVGAYFAGVPEWLIPAVAVLGGLGAAAYILFFA